MNLFFFKHTLVLLLVDIIFTLLPRLWQQLNMTLSLKALILWRCGRASSSGTSSQWCQTRRSVRKETETNGRAGAKEKWRGQLKLDISAHLCWTGWLLPQKMFVFCVKSELHKVHESCPYPCSWGKQNKTHEFLHTIRIYMSSVFNSRDCMPLVHGTFAEKTTIKLAVDLTVFILCVG